MRLRGEAVFHSRRWSFWDEIMMMDADDNKITSGWLEPSFYTMIIQQ